MIDGNHGHFIFGKDGWMLDVCKKWFSRGLVGLLAFVLCEFAALADSPQEAEAADLYSVIYTTASAYGADSVEADWIANAILYASSCYGVDPFLVTAVMQAESGFYLNSGSPAGAIGLMQLMPETAASIGVDPYDPLGNVIGGTIYLRTCLDDFASWGEYGVTDAVAAYNAGPGAVYQYGGVPPYRETQNYVVKVSNAYNNLVALSYQ